MMSHTSRPSSITRLIPPSPPCWLTRCSGRIFQEQLQRAGLDRQLADLVELVSAVPWLACYCWFVCVLPVRLDCRAMWIV